MDDYLAFAFHLADLAGAAILPHFRRAIDIENKASKTYFDPVTIADRAAEEAIRQELRRVYPTHGVYGEEQGRTAGDSGLTWVIDPIDGTRSFILGQLHWGTLIALNDGERPVLGIMHQPFVPETFAGTMQTACWKRSGVEHPMRTRACPRLEDAALSTTFFLPQDQPAFDRVAAKARMVRQGGDCYNYCLLAAGLIDLVIESGLHAYDVQAVTPMIEAAGGVITTWTGESPDEGGRIVAAGDPQLHEQILRLLPPHE
jgi:myo-inositol-1(or 4)-monophosphatase